MKTIIIFPYGFADFHVIQYEKNLPLSSNVQKSN